LVSVKGHVLTTCLTTKFSDLSVLCGVNLRWQCFSW